MTRITISDTNFLGVVDKTVNQNGVISVGLKYAGKRIRAYIVHVEEV